MRGLFLKPQRVESLDYLLSSVKKAHKHPRLLTQHQTGTIFITPSLPGFRKKNNSDQTTEINTSGHSWAGAWEHARRTNPSVTDTLLPRPLPQPGRMPMAVTTIQRGEQALTACLAFIFKIHHRTLVLLLSWKLRIHILVPNLTLAWEKPACSSMLDTQRFITISLLETNILNSVTIQVLQLERREQYYVNIRSSCGERCVSSSYRDQYKESVLILLDISSGTRILHMWSSPTWQFPPTLPSSTGV